MTLNFVMRRTFMRKCSHTTVTVCHKGRTAQLSFFFRTKAKHSEKCQHIITCLVTLLLSSVSASCHSVSGRKKTTVYIQTVTGPKHSAVDPLITLELLHILRHCLKNFVFCNKCPNTNLDSFAQKSRLKLRSSVKAIAQFLEPKITNVLQKVRRNRNTVAW